MSIYKLTDDDFKEYYTSIPLDLTEHYESVVKGMTKGDKLNTILVNNKENKPIFSDWNSLKNRFDSKGNFVAKNGNGITIKYSV